MNQASKSEILRVLTNRDKALLCKNFLLALSNMSDDGYPYVSMKDVYKKMYLKAYNLDAVMPVILEDYLLPNGLVEKTDGKIRITMDGRRISEQISKPETPLDEIMSIIESKSKVEGIDQFVPLMRELIFELRDMFRPKVFFDIVPDRRTNILNIVLRNSGKTPAYDLTCLFEPDLPYYDKVTLSSLPVFKNLPFLEPGKEITFFYKYFLSVLEDATFPKRTNVEIRYFDSKKNQYIEKYPIDLTRYKGIILSEFVDTSDIHRDLENIRRQLESLQRSGITLKDQDITKKDLVTNKKAKQD